MAIGNIFMLLMKAPPAQGGYPPSFPHPSHYQSVESWAVPQAVEEIAEKVGLFLSAPQKGI